MVCKSLNIVVLLIVLPFWNHSTFGQSIKESLINAAIEHMKEEQAKGMMKEGADRLDLPRFTKDALDVLFDCKAAKTLNPAELMTCMVRIMGSDPEEFARARQADQEFWARRRFCTEFLEKIIPEWELEVDATRRSLEDVKQSKIMKTLRSVQSEQRELNDKKEELKKRTDDLNKKLDSYGKQIQKLIEEARQANKEYIAAKQEITARTNKQSSEWMYTFTKQCVESGRLSELDRSHAIAEFESKGRFPYFYPTDIKREYVEHAVDSVNFVEESVKHLRDKYKKLTADIDVKTNSYNAEIRPKFAEIDSEGKKIDERLSAIKASYLEMSKNSIPDELRRGLGKKMFRLTLMDNLIQSCIQNLSDFSNDASKREDYMRWKEKIDKIMEFVRDANGRPVPILP